MDSRRRGRPNWTLFDEDDDDDDGDDDDDDEDKRSLLVFVLCLRTRWRLCKFVCAYVNQFGE